MRGFLTPDTEHDGEFTVYKLYVPSSSDDWGTLARGALVSLLHPWEWEPIGISIADTVEAWQDALELTFLWEECLTMTEQWKHYRLEQIASLGTDGGTENSGTVTTRALNAVRDGSEDDFVTWDLDNHTFELKNGEFYVQWGAICYRVGGFHAFLQRGSIRVGIGSSARSNGTNGDNQISEGALYLTEDETGATYYISSISENSQSGNGQGRAANAATTELYAWADIWRKEVSE